MWVEIHLGPNHLLPLIEDIHQDMNKVSSLSCFLIIECCLQEGFGKVNLEEKKFLQGNIPLMHLLNVETLLVSW